MKKPLIIFILSLIIGIGLGYIAYDVLGLDGSKNDEVASTNVEEEETSNEASEEQGKDDSSEPAASASDGSIFEQKGCLGCHAIKGLGLEGGATGPDLSQAFNNVEGKHGKPIEEFLKEPTSAVMSSVIAGSPLSDDEIAKIVEALQHAAH